MTVVPDRAWFDPVLNAHFHTGREAVRLLDTAPEGVEIATDIETPGLDRQFDINCVTVAWQQGGRMVTALLDPDRTEHHDAVLRSLYARASKITLHNAPFDSPALLRSGLLTSHDIRTKVTDTLVLARLADPNPMKRKGLAMLSARRLGLKEFTGGMDLAFKAAGYGNRQLGYESMDIDSPIYRFGAMADTVVTARLEPLLRQDCLDTLLDHPFVEKGATTVSEAEAIIADQETVLRVMLDRTAVGIDVDTEYLHTYRESVFEERTLAEAELALHGLVGGTGKGKALVAYLDSIGQLPEDWPRTATGQLSSAKAHLEELDHGLAGHQRFLASTDKVLGYLEKVMHQASVTGRCHPQVSVLGASATGRMAYSSPELQQFPADARPVLRADDGNPLWSIDWSQIEPVTMALMAGDGDFIAPFAAGADLYAPIMRAAGINRTIAKKVLLGSMYGQGVNKLAGMIEHTPESAAQIKRQMFAAMPKSARFMSMLNEIATAHGRVCTAAGRILPVDAGFEYKAVNYCIQGSAYDVLTATIVELERRGLADCIRLAMHDELVIEGGEDVAAEVQDVMQTVPAFLDSWPGHIDRLRTDREQLPNNAWAYV